MGHLDMAHRSLRDAKHQTKQTNPSVYEERMCDAPRGKKQKTNKKTNGVLWSCMHAIEATH